MAPQKVIIDTDPGIDDAMAILYACVHGDIDLLGLTTVFGNVTIDVATRNALGLIELAGQSVPVARGTGIPLEQAPNPNATDVHGNNGLGHVPPMQPQTEPIGRSAAEFICDTVAAHPGEVVLCPIAPLTNLAHALELNPEIVDQVKSVTIMGGSIRAGGNVTPHAEFNIWQDPHAADIVFGAPWNITLVGLDVTQKVVCDDADFSALAEAAPKLGGFLNDAVQYYFDFHHQLHGVRGCHMHDPTAVISILQPDFFELEESAVRVVVDGPRAGQTEASNDTQRPKSKLCLGVDVEQVKAQFLDTVRSSF